MENWNKKPSQYKHVDVQEFVNENLKTAYLKQFEDILIKINATAFSVYKLRFYDKQSLEAIAKKVNLKSRQRVLEILDQIESSMLTYQKTYEKITKDKLEVK